MIILQIKKSEDIGTSLMQVERQEYIVTQYLNNATMGGNLKQEPKVESIFYLVNSNNGKE